MNRRSHLQSLGSLVALTAFAADALAQSAKEPIYVYAYQEGTDPNDHEKHTLFIVGDGDKGSARYTAASFSNGRRYSLAASGSGTYAITGESITLKAGKLEGTGIIKRGEFIEVGSQKFVYATRL